jgi:hypothetical protein
VELARAFMRFQEHYESPRFSCAVFTRKEFTSWYNKRSSSAYYRDWAGFNFPGWVLNRFIDGSFTGLTKNEKKIVSYCKRIKGRFYVIGSTPRDSETLRHELAHALYCLSAEYRMNVLKIFADTKSNIPALFRKKLLKMGYSEQVILDEFQAYLIEKSKMLRGFSKTSELLNKNLDSFLRWRKS